MSQWHRGKSPPPTTIRGIVVEGKGDWLPRASSGGAPTSMEWKFVFVCKKNCKHHKLQSCINKLDKAGISQKKKKAHTKKEMGGRESKLREVSYNTITVKWCSTTETHGSCTHGSELILATKNYWKICTVLTESCATPTLSSIKLYCVLDQQFSAGVL